VEDRATVVDVVVPDEVDALDEQPAPRATRPTKSNDESAFFTDEPLGTPVATLDRRESTAGNTRGVRRDTLQARRLSHGMGT
jgi:hypothetical protein